jgi:hypothetical protein
MTKQDLQKMYKPRIDAEGKVWMLPQDVMENTVKAFNWSATSPTGLAGDAPTGRYIAPAQSADCIEWISSSYGTCGTRSLVLTSPLYWNFDLSVAKQIPIKGRINFDFRAEVFNAFNNTIFSAPGMIGYGSTMDNWEITSTYLSGRTVQMVFRVNF